MRKTLLIILILSLFACSNDAITDETVNTPTVTDEPIKEIKMAQGEIACIASGYMYIPVKRCMLPWNLSLMKMIILRIFKEVIL